MTENSKKRAHIFVSGRVQGVFFRDSTRKKAQKLGLTGWVRNLPDNRVEAVFEGGEAAIDKMISWVRQGPIFAEVDDLRVILDDYCGEFRDFQIKN